jgi:hypothetical protein
MCDFAEVYHTIFSSINSDPDSRNFNAVWQGFHRMALQIREDDGGGGSVFEHMLSDRGEIGSAPTYNDDFVKFVIFIKLVYSLNNIIKENKC